MLVGVLRVRVGVGMMVVTVLELMVQIVVKVTGVLK